MNPSRNSWLVEFDTRNRRRCASLAFIVAASTQAEALAMGMKLVRINGESTLTFHRPTVRQLSDEEQLDAAG